MNDQTKSAINEAAQACSAATEAIRVAANAMKRDDECDIYDIAGLVREMVAASAIMRRLYRRIDTK